MITREKIITIIMFSFLYNNTSLAQIYNYKLNEKKEITKSSIQGEKLSVDIEFPPPPKDSTQEESALISTLTVAASVIPTILNFSANAINRSVKNRLKKFVGEYNFRQTIVYPLKVNKIKKIILRREVKEKVKEKNSLASKIVLSRLDENNHIYKVEEVLLPISKAKGDSNYPYLNISIELELIFFDEKNSKLTSQKSSTINIPLIKIGSKNNFTDEKIYSSRFNGNNKPIEIKAKVIESNLSKVKYKDIESDVKEFTNDSKKITETLTVGILNEILNNLKEEKKKKEKKQSEEEDGI